MRALLAMALALAAGICIPVQAGINAILAKHLASPISSALISFLVGTAALLLVMLLARIPTGVPGALATAPAWVWWGGTLGAFLVAATIYAAPVLGAGTMISVVIASQLVTALVLDHFGWLGFDPTPISWPRL